MSSYPCTDTERRIDSSRLQALVSSIFLQCGMAQRDADLLSGLIIRADLRGCHSHGVLRVPDYVGKMQTGGVNPRGRPRVIKDHQGALVIDADNNMGQIACHHAMQLAIDRARVTSLAMACVQGSNHCGALADYAMMASDRDMIGVVGTNALPTMAPFGGIDKILGINPLAVAVPAGRHPEIVYDAAFSAASIGKIRVYGQKDVSLPAGWAFNVKGEPTSDAAEAIEGLLQPIGGYKGTGLALIVGLLSTLLTEASYGTELGNLVDGPRPGRDGHFCLVINVGAFIDVDAFKSKVDRVLDQWEASKLAPGFERVYAPGGLEAELEHRYGGEGIPLNEVVLKNLVTVAQGLHIDAKLDTLEVT